MSELYREGSCTYHLVRFKDPVHGHQSFVVKRSKSHVSVWCDGWRELVRSPKVSDATLVGLWRAIKGWM